MASEKILVVDDDTNICELLRLYLEKDGYEVLIANDGASAVKKFQDDIFHCPVRLSGREALNRREESAHRFAYLRKTPSCCYQYMNRSKPFSYAPMQ